MSRWFLRLLPLVLCTGCVEENWLREHWTKFSGEPAELAAVPSSSFVQTTTVAAANRPTADQAGLESAARVDTLGRQILAANQQLGVKPLFVTIGGQHSELFHIGTSEIYITEGLVKKCATDSQLAAILCHELGRMIAAREALAGPAARTQDRPLPLDLRVGNDHGGGLGSADLVHRAELLKQEQERRPSPGSPSSLANTRSLAEAYLYRAGHNPAELDAVAPLLKEASENMTYRRQLTGAQPARQWTR